MRTFRGLRPAPPADYEAKGITNSGLTPDYEGVIFSDGTVVLRWQTEYRSHSIWRDYATFYQVHGHPEYGTVIEFDDDQPEPSHFVEITVFDDGQTVSYKPATLENGLKLVTSDNDPSSISVYNERLEC